MKEERDGGMLKRFISLFFFFELHTHIFFVDAFAASMSVACRVRND